MDELVYDAQSLRTVALKIGKSNFNPAEGVVKFIVDVARLLSGRDDTDSASDGILEVIELCEFVVRFLNEVLH